jgi:hypothetical protein
MFDRGFAEEPVLRLRRRKNAFDSSAQGEWKKLSAYRSETPEQRGSDPLFY